MGRHGHLGSVMLSEWWLALNWSRHQSKTYKIKWNIFVNGKINIPFMKLSASRRVINILSCANEVVSLTNHLGSGQRRDTEQGPFSPLTGGLDKVYLMTDHLKFKNTDHTGPVLLRQGEPGTPQYNDSGTIRTSRGIGVYYWDCIPSTS